MFRPLKKSISWHCPFKKFNRSGREESVLLEGILEYEVGMVDVGDGLVVLGLAVGEEGRGEDAPEGVDQRDRQEDYEQKSARIAIQHFSLKRFLNDDNNSILIIPPPRQLLIIVPIQIEI